VEAQKPLTDRLEKALAEVAKQKGVEVAPLRAILAKLGDSGVSDENVPSRFSGKAGRTDQASRGKRALATWSSRIRDIRRASAARD
jgi:hypothetical protein